MDATGDQPSELRRIPAAGSGSRALLYDADCDCLWVLNRDSNNFSLFELSVSGPSLLRTMDLSLGHLNKPIAAVMDEVSKSLWVLGGASENVVLIDGSDPLHGLQFLAETSTKPYPRDLAFCPRNQRVFVSNAPSNDISCFAAWDLQEEQGSPIDSYASPEKMLITPGGLLLASNLTSESLSMISTLTLEHIQTSPLFLTGAAAGFTTYSSEPADSVPPIINGVTLLRDTTDQGGPYPIDVTEIRDDGKLSQAFLLYSLEYQGTTNTFKQKLDHLAGHSFRGTITGQPRGTRISYGVKAIDASGNTAISQRNIFRIIGTDREPPQSWILDPSQGDYLSGATYTIRGKAQDNESGVDRVEVSTDGGQTWTNASGDENWTFLWTLPGDGTYQLASRATDGDGNIEVPGGSIQVFIDTFSPSIVLAGYWNTSLAAPAGGTLVLVALSTDPDVKHVEVTYQGTATGIFLYDDGSNNDLSAANDGFFGVKIPVAAPVAPLAHVRLDLQAVDEAGNASVSWPLLHVTQH